MNKFYFFLISISLYGCMESASKIKNNPDGSISIISNGETHVIAERNWHESASEACNSKTYTVNNSTGNPIIGKKGGMLIAAQDVFMNGIYIKTIPARRTKVTYEGYERIFCN